MCSDWLNISPESCQHIYTPACTAQCRQHQRSLHSCQPQELCKDGDECSDWLITRVSPVLTSFSLFRLLTVERKGVIGSLGTSLAILQCCVCIKCSDWSMQTECSDWSTPHLASRDIKLVAQVSSSTSKVSQPASRASMMLAA